MHRISLAFAALAVAIPAPIVFAAPATASAPETVQFCKEDVPNNPPAVLGDCIGLINNLSNDTPGFIRFKCDVIEMFAPDLFYSEYDNISQCIVDRGAKLDLPF
ncbi:MAG TPA: hypothetical protein VFK50_07905 [Sphingomicrobium sp.]|nr:hypothetical protein [Sphingomicrobium sp.]